MYNVEKHRVDLFVHLLIPFIKIWKTNEKI